MQKNRMKKFPYIIDEYTEVRISLGENDSFQFKTEDKRKLFFKVYGDPKDFEIIIRKKDEH